MGGIGLALARRSAARALLAGAVLVAATFTAEARGQPHAIAAAAEPPARSGSSESVLPRPLDTAAADRARRIFDAQRRGDLQTAFRESEQLDIFTPVGHALLGEILSDRYLGRFYAASPAELSGWLLAYGDQPEARAVYVLLLLRLPKEAAAPAPPVPTWLAERKPAIEIVSGDPAVGPGPVRAAALERAVRERSENGQTEAALALIARARSLSTRDGTELRALVARAKFAASDDDAAFDLAKSAFTDSGGEAGSAAYVAGLAAWRSERTDEARLLFEAAAIGRDASSALRAAGSFWTARALLRDDDLGNARFWLLRAAEETETFYGMLAAGVLAEPVRKPARPTRYREVLAVADVEAIAATPEGLAAFALLQLGENARAEAELRQLALRLSAEPGMIRAIKLVAETAGLGKLRSDMARKAAFAAAAVPDLEPIEGFSVDPALVYGLVRTESNFNSAAVSGGGARGLMQLTPLTARALAGNAAANPASLQDPERNVELGQRYVLYLAHKDTVGENLIRLLASYNAGPNKCAGWQIHDDGDPLLFIESIPNQETRMFVQRVLAFTWIYARRLDLPAPSLDQLASGDFPHVDQSPTAVTPVLMTTRVQLH